MLIIIITIICYKFVTNSFILSIFVNSGMLSVGWRKNVQNNLLIINSSSSIYLGGRHYFLIKF